MIRAVNTVSMEGNEEWEALVWPDSVLRIKWEIAAESRRARSPSGAALGVFHALLSQFAFMSPSPLQAQTTGAQRGQVPCPGSHT